MSRSHPLAGVEEFWDDVMADTEATAEDYRDAGWDVLELHPGDVTPLPTAEESVDGDTEDDENRPVGLDVLLQSDEFDEVEARVDGAAFDEYDAFRAEEDDVVFLVVAMKSESTAEAVIFPVYYTRDEAATMLRLVADRGEMRTYLRSLDAPQRVVFSQRDPASLLPSDFDYVSEP